MLGYAPALQNILLFSTAFYSKDRVLQNFII